MPDQTNTAKAAGGSRAPSRVARVQVTAHVSSEVRRALKMLAAEQEVTLQHLLCVAINDLLEKHGQTRLADEEMLPRGGAAQNRSGAVAGNDS